MIVIEVTIKKSSVLIMSWAWIMTLLLQFIALLLLLSAAAATCCNIHQSNVSKSEWCMLKNGRMTDEKRVPEVGRLNLIFYAAVKRKTLIRNIEMFRSDQ